jgi:hypothetical protein
VSSAIVISNPKLRSRGDNNLSELVQRSNNTKDVVEPFSARKIAVSTFCDNLKEVVVLG